MQQYCTYGSVRGAPGNRRSYRDKTLGGLLPAYVICGENSKTTGRLPSGLPW
jgi:hypothetical protein